MAPKAFLIAVGVVLVEVAFAMSAEPSQEFDTIVRNIRTEREKLTSGVVRITGTEGVEYPANPTRSKAEPFEIIVAFDADQLRFDTSENGYVLNPDTGQLMPGRIDRKYLRTKGKIGTWASGRRTRVDEPNRPPIGRGELFDLQALGIRGWVGRPTDADKVFVALLNHPWTKGVDHSNPDRLMISVVGGNPKGRVSDFRIWVSPLGGYTVTRCELLRRLRPEEPWMPAEQCNTRWQEAGGTWVPVHHDWSLYGSSKRRTFLELDLEWESVNKPVAPKWFEIESLGPEAKVEDMGE